MSRTVLRLVATAVLLGAIAVAALFLMREPAPETPAQTAIPQAQDEPEAVVVPEGAVLEMQQGNPDAAVTVMEYASYTCPHCASFHANQYKQLKADYIDTGLINFVYREVFFDRYGLWASMVARCGNNANRFFGISEMLYAQQRDWTAGAPAEIAEKLNKLGVVAGLTQQELDACLADGENAQTLFAWFQQNADADGINSTPTILVNGQNLGNPPYAELKAAIDEKLGQ